MLDVHARVFPEFDVYAWLDAVSPYVYLMHYSNVRYGNGNFHRHLPVLPEQESQPDYGDAFSHLKLVAARNTRFHVTFEHDPQLVTTQDLRRCYDAVHDLLQNSRAGEP